MALASLRRLSSSACFSSSLISALVASSSRLIFRALAGPRCAPGSLVIPCAARLAADIGAVPSGIASLQSRAHSPRIHRSARRSSSSRAFGPMAPSGPTWRVVSMMWAWGFPGRSQWTAPVVATPYRWRSESINAHVSRTCSRSSSSRGIATFSARAVRAFFRFSAASAAVQRFAVSTWLPSAVHDPRSPICCRLVAAAWLPYVLSSRASYMLRAVMYAARCTALCPALRATMDMDR